MKSFENIDAKSIKEAVSLLQKFQQRKEKRSGGRWRERIPSTYEGPSGNPGLCDQLEDYSRP